MLVSSWEGGPKYNIPEDLSIKDKNEIFEKAEDLRDLRNTPPETPSSGGVKRKYKTKRLKNKTEISKIIIKNNYMQESNLYKVEQLQTSPDCVDCGDFIKKVSKTLNKLKKTPYETPDLYIEALNALKEDEIACMSVKCPNPCMEDHYICIICINDNEFEIYSKNGRKVIKPFTVLKSVFCDNYLNTIDMPI